MCHYIQGKPVLCPKCHTTQVKKNGKVASTNKQNYKCKACNTQFSDPESRAIQAAAKALKRKIILKLLNERISLRGICRAMEISLSWLLRTLLKLIHKLPDDLHFNAAKIPNHYCRHFYLQRIDYQADEMWSYVGNKKNKRWIWICMEQHSRQIVAFYVGSRDTSSAQSLWDRIPEVCRIQGKFYTDDWEPYKKVIPINQHVAILKKCKTNHIERFNCTLRQRCSRLVRKTLSFSKSEQMHVGHIKYFLCNYNLNLNIA